MSDEPTAVGTAGIMSPEMFVDQCIHDPSFIRELKVSFRNEDSEKTQSGSLGKFSSHHVSHYFNDCMWYVAEN